MRDLMLISLLLIFLLQGSVLAQGLEGVGSIDWEAQALKATGVGVPDTTLPRLAQREDALKTAERMATEILLETLKGANLTSEKAVGDTMAADSLVARQVEGIIGESEMVHIRTMSDLSVEADVEIPLAGPLSEILLPELGAGEPVTADTLHCPLCGQPWPADRPFPKQLLPLPALEGQVYTGLIVDARGLDIQPAIAPKILNEEGKEIYGPGFADRRCAIPQGIVGYRKDLEQAMEDRRIGAEPLLVKGLRASGSRKTDIVIPNAQALVLHSVKENLAFLKQCKVLILLD